MHGLAISHQYSPLTFAQNVDAFKTQQTPQHFDFSFQFTNEFGVGIFVNDGLTDDLLRAIRVPGSTADTLFRPVKIIAQAISCAKIKEKNRLR